MEKSPKRHFFCISLISLDSFLGTSSAPFFSERLIYTTPVARIEHAEGPSEGGCHGLPGENTDVNVGPETKPKTLRFGPTKSTQHKSTNLNCFMEPKKRCTLTNVAKMMIVKWQPRLDKTLPAGRPVSRLLFSSKLWCFLSLGYNWANVSLQQLTISATIFTICPIETLLKEQSSRPSGSNLAQMHKITTSGDLPRTEFMTPGPRLQYIHPTWQMIIKQLGHLVL